MTKEEAVIGLNIRKEPSGSSAKLGLLPRGARVLIGERSKDGKWGKIKQILSGQVAPVELGGAIAHDAEYGWVFLGELDPAVAEPEAYDSVVVPAKPVPIRAGERVGHMGEYQHYHDIQPTPRRGARPLLHLEVFSTEDVPAFIEASREYARSLPAGSGTLFVIEKGAKLVSPSRPSHRLDPAQALMETSDSPEIGPWAKVRRAQAQVHAREVLGAYNSATKRYANGTAWTGWYVGANSTQRTRDEAVAKKLGYNLREVRVPSGDPIWVERAVLKGAIASIPAWNAFPLQIAHQADPACEFARVMTREELERASPEQRALDADGNKWWLLTLRRPAGAAEEGAAQASLGWVREKGHPKVSWQSPWAWPGFELVEEGAVEPADMYANALDSAGAARPVESRDFKARVDKVESSALVQTLYRQIDMDGNGRFDAAELRATARQPLLAQALSRLIAKYESEWGGDEAKWNALDPLMLDGKPEWAAEKGRIKRLQWWPNVSSKMSTFPADSHVYHFHPIGLIANFQLPARAQEAPASADDGAAMERSGKQWVRRFPSSSSLASLKQPFQGNVASFIAALEAGGITVSINTTLRPPQRSYLMYYAREVSTGNLAPDKVPKFEPKNGDKPVNIDWAHRDGNGRVDLVSAKKAAKAMDTAYAAAGAIGKPYRSNHNGGKAIDMRLTPTWGIGKTVIDARGRSVKIDSKQKIIDVGATYGVLHWNYSGSKSKVDDPHWSATGD